MKSPRIVSFFAAVSFASCGLSLADKSVHAAEATPTEYIDASASICAGLEPDTRTPFEAADRDAVTQFYKDRDCQPVWVDEHGPTRAAASAIAEIGRAGEWGLKASDFKLTMAAGASGSKGWTPDQTADAEFEIMAAMLRYAHQAQGGRITEPDKRLSSYLDRRPTLTPAADLVAQLTLAADPGAVLRSYQPPQEQFLRLKALLAKLRDNTGAPAPVTIPETGDVLQLGSENADVALLKKRFGIASNADAERKFDEALSAAVRKFQAENGLSGDGIVGPMTRAALSGGGPADSSGRIAAVIANMEEWRWMPRTLGAKHVFVNIPAFSIAFNVDDKPVFQERVIVGTPETQTPIFSKDMSTVVLRPPWYLPDSIKVARLRSGRSVERQGLVVERNGRVIPSWKVNWGKVNIAEYSIYQPSGDDNALGLVKLLFPNKHSVYLHDTPDKWLFDQPVRLYSHGCMRVRNPQALAQKVLDFELGEGAADVKTLVRKGPLNNVFALSSPIPVHVAYFTVWVDDNGEANFYSDYYGHQKRITLALAGKWDQIDIGADHLAAVDTSGLRDLDDGSRRKKSDDDDELDPPMGLTNASDGPKQYRPRGNSVGDIMRQSMGGW